MVSHCACDKKLPTNLVRLLTAHGHGYVAVNYFFISVNFCSSFVLNSLSYITIPKKQWKNKN